MELPQLVTLVQHIGSVGSRADALMLGLSPGTSSRVVDLCWAAHQTQTSAVSTPPLAHQDPF